MVYILIRRIDGTILSYHTEVRSLRCRHQMFEFFEPVEDDVNGFLRTIDRSHCTFSEPHQNATVGDGLDYRCFTRVSGGETRRTSSAQLG